MDYFLDDITSPSTCDTIHRTEELQMTDDPDSDLLRQNLSGVIMTELHQQHSSSSVDDINNRAQELVEKINNSRASNQNVMDSFKEKLVEKVTEKCLQIEEHIFTVYEDNSNDMEVKLQELSTVLESCTKLTNELREASQALAHLRQGLAISQTSESS